MPHKQTDHLALAKEDLAIAESGDAKREAYKRAANHIAAHKKASGETWAGIAIPLGKSEETLRKLDKWRRGGFKAETPFLMDKGATTRAAKSHAKAVLKDPETRKAVIADLTEKERLEVANAALEPTVERGEREKQERRVVRESKAKDPSGAHYQMILLDLAKAKEAVRRAIGVAEDATWPEERTQRLEARIEVLEAHLDLLRRRIQNESDVDWDAELANLVESEEEAR